MKLEAIPFTELEKQSEDIYTAAKVASERMRQIIDERFIERVPFDEVADDVYSINELEPNEDYEEKDKAIVIALSELMKDELKWSYCEPDKKE